MCFRSESGQATLEAAFLLPVLLVVFGVFLQPMLLLYDRCVMQTAAAETCRMLATSTQDEQAAREYALRRLGAVPNVPVFHEGGRDGWTVEVSGGELSRSQVEITHRVVPLPLLGVAAGLSSQRAGDGCAEQEVSASASCTPQWVLDAAASPDEWIGAWT